MDSVVILNTLLEIADAIGLGTFAVIGASFAMGNPQHEMVKPLVEALGDNGLTLFSLHWTSVVLFAILTGAGGGIIRDVVTGAIPYTFSASWYALFPAVGGGLFFLICKCFPTGAAIPFWAVLVPIVVVTVARLLYWHYREYVREQYSATVLMRDEQGRYLTEEGKSGSLNFIGGKWHYDDKAEDKQEMMRNTALREIREETGLRLEGKDLRFLELKKSSRDKNGFLQFRTRSLRTGEMTLYHIAVFECVKKISSSELTAIRAFRENPILPYLRLFTEIELSKIQPSEAHTKANEEEANVIVENKIHPVSLSLFRRIREALPDDTRYVDGKKPLDDLPPRINRK